MKNKQTAVEWLIQRIYMSDFEIYNFMKENGDFEQAKAMEKEQIIDAFGIGCHHESKRLVGYHHIAEQYYNETYRKEA
jgi:hypothetical protein